MKLPTYCAAGGAPGPQQHQHDENLCENHRGGGPGASGACGEPNILRKKEKIPHYADNAVFQRR